MAIMMAIADIGIEWFCHAAPDSHKVSAEFDLPFSTDVV